jgi:DNA-binding transcriptional LysR family regulator
VDLGQLEAFQQVAIQRSFRRAGEALFLTQPSISARIQTLERELGELLFERQGRTVRLTDAGQAFLPYAERALQAVKEGQAAIEGLRRAASGQLVIGSARIIGTYTLPKIVKHFRERYPGIDVVIRTGRSQEILEMVLADEVQIGLTRQLRHPDVQTTPLYDEEIVLVTYPRHPFAFAGGTTITQIGREPLILYHKDSTYYTIINEVCREAGIIPHVVMELDSVESTKKMVEQGMGISLLPRSSIERELELGTLTEIQILDASPIHLPAAAIYRKTERLDYLVRAFLEVIHHGLEEPSAAERPASRAARR